MIPGSKVYGDIDARIRATRKDLDRIAADLQKTGAKLERLGVEESQDLGRLAKARLEALEAQEIQRGLGGGARAHAGLHAGAKVGHGHLQGLDAEGVEIHLVHGPGALSAEAGTIGIAAAPPVDAGGHVDPAVRTALGLARSNHARRVV